MATKESEEMKVARNLVVTHGYSPYKAAQIAGITKQAIYLSAWYKVWKASKSN